MSLGYDLVPPREPLCTAHFQYGLLCSVVWHTDEDEFRAAWPFLKRMGYRIEDEHGKDCEADVMGENR